MNALRNALHVNLAGLKAKLKRRATSSKRTFSTTILALLALFITLPAQATLIHDLSINELSGFTGAGQITFATDSGNSNAGVSAFSFAGTGSQGGFSFSLGDIANIEWSIDAVTSALTLDLETNAIMSAPGISTCLILQNDNDGFGTCGGILKSYNSYSRVAQQRIGRTTTGIGSLITTPVQVQPIPEPSPLALLIAGLAMLGFTRRKAQRQQF